MTHPCRCQTANRRLGVSFGPLVGKYEAVDDLITRFSEEYDPELASASFPVGPDCRFAGPGAVCDLLLGVLGPNLVQSVRATWLEQGALREHAGALLRAEPITTLAPAAESPIGGILEHRRLETWFQPVFDREGRIWGYECLVRARDDAGDIISPAKIIEWARAEDLLFMFDRVARETHIASAAASNAPAHARFLINFIPTVIYEPAFCLRTTFEALRATDLSPGQFIFEVVETDRVEDIGHLRSILDYYRENGFGVALDDVGAGYSGLTMMAELEPDLIKIDRGIVMRIEQSEAHAGVCRSLIDIARRQGKSVLAEGIETQSQQDLLLDLGVDLFQGFLLGRPAPEPATVPLTA